MKGPYIQFFQTQKIKSINQLLRCQIFLFRKTLMQQLKQIFFVKHENDSVVNSDPGVYYSARAAGYIYTKARSDNVKIGIYIPHRMYQRLSLLRINTSCIHVFVFMYLFTHLSIISETRKHRIHDKKDAITKHRLSRNG